MGLHRRRWWANEGDDVDVKKISYTLMGHIIHDVVLPSAFYDLLTDINSTFLSKLPLALERACFILSNFEKLWGWATKRVTFEGRSIFIFIDREIKLSKSDKNSLNLHHIFISTGSWTWLPKGDGQKIVRKCWDPQLLISHYSVCSWCDECLRVRE